MNDRKKIPGFANVCRNISVVVMMACLTLLTCLNYFIYSPEGVEVAGIESGFGTEESENDYPPTGPTEEKSASSGTTLSEEILHELHPEFNFKASNQLYLHHIAEAENIEMFHPELILPPPKA